MWITPISDSISMTLVHNGLDKDNYATASVERYDLVLFNLQTNDTGTYKCIAKSEGSEKLIGTTTLNVNTRKFYSQITLHFK